MKREKPIRLQVGLRGDRHYLHGTDLFNSIHSAFLDKLGTPSLKEIKFKIPRFYTSPLDLLISEAPIPGPPPEWTCSTSGHGWRGHLVDAPSAPPPLRRPFDEGQLMKLMRRNERQAVLTDGEGLTPIESAIFLAKFLHYDLYPLAPSFQWIFTRIDLHTSFPAGSAGKMQVSLESTLSDFFTKSSILIDGVHCGFIYFSKVDKNSRKTALAQP